MKSQIFLIGLENVLPDVQPEPAPQKVTVRVFIGSYRGKLPCMLVEGGYD